ncbi:MAG: succinate dehydrogenase, cytochrome b556 subunit [Pseudomonadota bacterium]
MKTDRPVNLNLFTISLPLAGVVSFTHRVTGIALFVGVAFGLYALDMALSSDLGFAQAAAMVREPFPRFILLGLIFVLVFHVVAGIKHLLLDFHVGDSLAAARMSAVAVIVVTVLVTGVLGALLW